MNKVTVKNNRYHEGVEYWKDSEYYFHLGENIEVTQNFFYLIEFRLLEHVGCLHTGFKDIKGTKVYCDDFITFRNTDRAKFIYHRFLEEGNITKILEEERVEPVIYNPLQLLLIHADPDEQPTIVSKRKN